MRGPSAPPRYSAIDPVPRKPKLCGAFHQMRSTISISASFRQPRSALRRGSRTLMWERPRFSRLNSGRLASAEAGGTGMWAAAGRIRVAVAYPRIRGPKDGTPSRSRSEPRSSARKLVGVSLPRAACTPLPHHPHHASSRIRVAYDRLRGTSPPAPARGVTSRPSKIWAASSNEWVSPSAPSPCRQPGAGGYSSSCRCQILVDLCYVAPDERPQKRPDQLPLAIDFPACSLRPGIYKCTLRSKRRVADPHA